MGKEDDLEALDPFPPLSTKVSKIMPCAKDGYIRQFDPRDLIWQKFCEVCRPMKKIPSPPASSQRKRPSSNISPLALEAKKSPAILFENIDISSWKMLSPDELWNEIEAVFQIETARKAKIMRELTSIKN